MPDAVSSRLPTITLPGKSMVGTEASIPSTSDQMAVRLRSRAMASAGCPPNGVARNGLPAPEAVGRFASVRFPIACVWMSCSAPHQLPTNVAASGRIDASVFAGTARTSVARRVAMPNGSRDSALLPSRRLTLRLSALDHCGAKYPPASSALIAREAVPPVVA
jgi:hypothetical protein